MFLFVDSLVKKGDGLTEVTLPETLHSKVIVSKDQMSRCTLVHFTFLPVVALVHSDQVVIHSSIEVTKSPIEGTPIN